MQIDQESADDLLELTVSGDLDNESSTHLRDAIDDHVRDGWHRILVHMQGVGYVSSAGISVLVATQKRLKQLQGHFGICAPTQEVARTLQQMRLLDQLACDPNEFRVRPSGGNYTLSLSSRIARDSGLDLQIYQLDERASSTCTVLGSPRLLFESTFGPEHCRSIEMSHGTLAIGLGALGQDFATVRSRCGELLGVAGAVTQSAQSRRQLPDYSVSTGEFHPNAQLLYGVQCEGAFAELIRFEPVEPGAPVKLSDILSACLRQANRSSVGVVILAESAGLLGTHLRRSPAEDTEDASRRFRFPEVREWLSFSPERVYSRHLVLIVGVAKMAGTGESTSPLDDLLRPVDQSGEVFGHLHAAVFPYRPLKKRTLDLHSTVREQFESGAVEDVLHLLRDDRPAGVGESELLSGACWLSPISEIIGEEETR